MADSERKLTPNETPAQKDAETAEGSLSDEATTECDERGREERQISTTCISSTADSAAVPDPSPENVR